MLVWHVFSRPRALPLHVPPRLPPLWPPCCTGRCVAVALATSACSHHLLHPTISHADDTKAFLAAIANASAQAAASGKGVAVAVPPGQYRITQQLTIDASRVVLRGAGVSKDTQW